MWTNRMSQNVIKILPYLAEYNAKNSSDVHLFYSTKKWYHYYVYPFTNPSLTKTDSYLNMFLISNFRLVLYVVCFLLGNSPASEFYMPTFRNTLFHLHRRIGVSPIRLWRWVIPRRLNFICRRFGTLCLFHLHRRIDVSPIRLWRWNRECSETSAYEIQAPGNYPEESIQYSEQGESLKSWIYVGI